MPIEFTLHDASTAPAESKPLLEQAKQKLGMVPNMFRVMAEAPALLKAYQMLSGILDECSLSPIEQQVVFQTANVENNCHYCVPAHTAISKSIGMPNGAIEALRNGSEIPSLRLAALHRFTRALLETRGNAPDDEVQRLLDAGYTKQQVLEVVAGLALKVMSNYANALANTPLGQAVRQVRVDQTGGGAYRVSEAGSRCG
jgi:uncharacterized peroxidase-related enzyme